MTDNHTIQGFVKEYVDEYVGRYILTSLFVLIFTDVFTCADYCIILTLDFLRFFSNQGELNLSSQRQLPDEVTIQKFVKGYVDEYVGKY